MIATNKESEQPRQQTRYSVHFALTLSNTRVIPCLIYSLKIQDVSHLEFTFILLVYELIIFYK